MTFFVNVISGEDIYHGGFLSEILFIQNYHSGIWAHTWSLAVEEHFYIFLSLLFWSFYVSRQKIISKIHLILSRKFSLLLAVVCLVLRVITVEYAGFNYEVNIEQTHLRFDSLFFGVFLSYLWNFRGLADNKFLQKNKFSVGLAGICCFVPAFIFELNETFWLETFWLTMLYLGGGFLLLALLKTDFGNSKILHFLAEIGKYSYSIYLWNLPTHFWLTKYTNIAAENWFLYIFIYWTGTLILGIGTAKLIEYPILRLRDKLTPSQVYVLQTA